MDFRSILRCFPLRYRFYLRRINNNAILGNHMSKKAYFTQPEFTLRQLHIELLFFQQLQYNSKMFCMLFVILRIDQNFINKDYHKLIKIRMKYPVHILHENTKCISNSKQHNRILIMSIPRSKCSFLNIFLLHLNLMISRSQINLTEYTSTNQWIHQIINPRQWMPILD